MNVPNHDEVTAPAQRLRPFTGVLLLAAVLLVFGSSLGVLAAQTAGDTCRMALAAVLAELIGLGISGAAVNILKKARAEHSSRSPTLVLRSALVVGRVTFWASILLAVLLSLVAFFSLALSFGLSG